MDLDGGLSCKRQHVPDEGSASLPATLAVGNGRIAPCEIAVSFSSRVQGKPLRDRGALRATELAIRLFSGCAKGLFGAA